MLPVPRKYSKFETIDKYSKASFIRISFIRVLHLDVVLVNSRFIPFHFNAKTVRLYGNDFSYTAFPVFFLSVKWHKGGKNYLMSYLVQR